MAQHQKIDYVIQQRISSEIIPKNAFDSTSAQSTERMTDVSFLFLIINSQQVSIASCIIITSNFINHRLIMIKMNTALFIQQRVTKTYLPQKLSTQSSLKTPSSCTVSTKKLSFSSKTSIGCRQWPTSFRSRLRLRR